MGFEDAFKKVGLKKVKESESPLGDGDLDTETQTSIPYETPGRPRRTVQQAWKAVKDAPSGTVWHANDRDIRIIEAAERNSKKQKEKE